MKTHTQNACETRARREFQHNIVFVRFGCHFSRFLVYFGASGVPWAVSRRPLGAPWATLGAPRGVSGPPLGTPGGVWGPSGHHFGRPGGALGAFGAAWDRFWLDPSVWGMDFS